MGELLERWGKLRFGQGLLGVGRSLSSEVDYQARRPLEARSEITTISVSINLVYQFITNLEEILQYARVEKDILVERERGGGGSKRTQELAMWPKYLVRPDMLMDKDPKASTISGFGSSSLGALEASFLSSL